jgi:hypothetical protein
VALKAYLCARCGNLCTALWRSKKLTTAKLPNWPEEGNVNLMVCRDCKKKESES